MVHYVKREIIPITVTAGAVTLAVSVGASHAESAAIPAELVRVVSTVAAYIEFGTNPIATNASMYLPAARARVLPLHAGPEG
jgi:hypothetical protein